MGEAAVKIDDVTRCSASDSEAVMATATQATFSARVKCPDDHTSQIEVTLSTLKYFPTFFKYVHFTANFTSHSAEYTDVKCYVVDTSSRFKTRHYE